ncbi:MAG: hypothetical protein FWB91_01715 [Defluviitaleaceae bacterium]|nr:hypothetical protein [Defluviitaleaceae bacterium]
MRLIKYNLGYYLRTPKYLPPLLLFAAFFAINYQVSPVGIWSNLHIVSIAVFILANWIGASLIDSEDVTQQFITRLHVQNERLFHGAKIASALIFAAPLYILIALYPMVAGLFPRSLLFGEILVYFIVLFLMSLLGVSIGIFFNSYFLNKEMKVLAHLIVVLITAIPLNVVFEDNLLVVYLYYLLPPVNFLADRLYGLNDGVFLLDFNFWVFVAYALGYSLALIGIYIFAIQRKNKK